jgi:hypothetical protein
MSKVTIFLATDDIMLQFLIAGSDCLSVAKHEFWKYTVAKQFFCGKTGVDAAEEAFDITNNPDRFEERNHIHGNLRPIYDSDVVDVDGAKYIRMGIGWEILK